MNKNIAPLYSPQHALLCDSLFELVQPSTNPEDGFSFQINDRCSLLAEHFPGFAVVPASLIINLVSSNLTQAKPLIRCEYSLENIRFNNAMVPHKHYRCEFKNQQLDKTLFSISDDSGVLYCRGLLTPILEVSDAA
ncbi:hypothetical protein [Pseudoalteromonas tunicata]|nr:hypothetical protein [Pseudoalteromonas tunicata]ATC96437.1 hypothetical protein PTUN_a4240 [Pseudoalteromonas tunicata]AXT31922.1 hypothetical protein D1819_14580 [Pseudoalteromonas tunicata]MDP4982241.1 hypothetical protein [Pseudoalteromonas tunicata]MDP5212336.1 hypothetical protein [Pseudoalteromonas tunicata]